MHRTVRLEEDPPTKELAENATYAPNVHGGRVVSRSHQDFRRTIILRHHFLGHVLVLIRFFHSGQTEVADLFAENTCNFLAGHQPTASFSLIFELEQRRVVVGVG